MSSGQEISSLIVDMQEEINKGINIDISEEKHDRYKKYCEYVTHLNKKIANEKLKYVFIGEKGKGKTTTILNLFDLNSSEKELLATGSGGTTVCEVELMECQGAEPYIEVVPMEDRYMNQYIYDFCSSYNNHDNNESTYLPTEIGRSIRNMLGMKRSEVSEWFNQIDDINLFLSEVNNKLNLDGRTETIITCKSDKEGKYFTDIQKKFNQVNLGKITNVKIPKKIVLHLTKDILDFTRLETTSTIVDTRGIDNNLNKESNTSEVKEKDNFRREDIMYYIDEKQDESIFLFIDGIKSAPAQNILETIKSRITPENADRFYLFINIYFDEAEKVMTDDGPAETVENGVEYRKDDIMDKFKQENMPFKESNVIFYNSKNDYPPAFEILDSISNNIKKSKSIVLERVEDVKTAFYKLKYDHENNEAALEYFEELYSVVSNITPTRNLVDEIVFDFVNERMAKVHSSRLNAINRAKGDYVAFNFYHYFNIAIEKAFDRIYLEAKNDVLKKVNDFLKFRNITKLEEIDYRAFLDKLQRDYIRQRASLSLMYKELLEANFYEGSWEEAVSEYGRGSGRYTWNVCDIYIKEINRLNDISPFRELFTKSWMNIIADNNLIKLENTN